MDIKKEMNKKVNTLFGILCLIPCLNIAVPIVILGQLSGLGYTIPYFYCLFAIPQFIFPVITAFLVAILCRFTVKNRARVSDFKEPMTFGDGFMLTMIFLGAIFILEIISVLNTLFFNSIGIYFPQLSYSTFIPTDPLQTIVFIIVIAVLPALSEEIIYRFFVCGSLSEYSAAGAVTVSAIAFGLMHGNLQQLLYATAAGLVLGYIFLKTKNIRFTIFLHFFNNILSSVYLLTERYLGIQAYEIMFSAVTLVSVVGCIFCSVFYFRKKGFSLNYGKKPVLPTYSVIGSVLKAPFFYLFTVLEVGLMLLNMISGS